MKRSSELELTVPGESIANLDNFIVPGHITNPFAFDPATISMPPVVSSTWGIRRTLGLSSPRLTPLAQNTLATNHARYKPRSLQTTLATNHARYKPRSLQTTLATNHARYKPRSLQTTLATNHARYKPRSLQTTLATNHARYYEDHSFLGASRPNPLSTSPRSNNPNSQLPSTELQSFPRRQSLQLSNTGSRFRRRQRQQSLLLGLLQCPPPCNFVIFAAGNPLTGTGTCWLYPGESFDVSAGSSDCANPYLSVYGQPVCPGSGTPTSGNCAATATPTAVASVCGYPTPPDNCFSTCTASEGASDCLSQCAKADSCSYIVFNPHNPDNSPYSLGTCWMYPSGSYDAGAATTCSGPPEQFVYNNVCPKPSPSSSSASSSAPVPSSAASINSTEASTNRIAGTRTAGTGSTASETVGAGTVVAAAALATTTILL
ncbi:hypothetical protein TrVGV298_006689 [Trichoderma virens]|nr:hypothetical protein TrVGV298_006689 [Trichoderma virens]